MSTPTSEKAPTLIIIDGGEVETFGEEPDIIDWVYVMDSFNDYEPDELIAIRDRIAQYEGTEEYVAALNEKLTT